MRLTIVPAMLGFASSLARKSRYGDLPKVNSSMNGAERAQLLSKHRVMMQDVKPNVPVGKVALGSAYPSAERLREGETLSLIWIALLRGRRCSLGWIDVVMFSVLTKALVLCCISIGAVSVSIYLMKHPLVGLCVT